jgi:predicted acyltransferase
MVTQSAPASVDVVPGQTIQSRLVSLDVFRGLIIAGMVLVTDPGSYNFVYPQLLHAQWNGATATDMIFPSFLFIVGVAITLSFASRLQKGSPRSTLAKHVVRRAAIIFVLGLAVNGFPDYHLHTLRIPGILQRIAICYLIAGLLYLATSRDEKSRSRQTAIFATLVVVILAGYWALLKLVPVPGFGPGRLDSLGNLPAYIDRMIFGTNHLWAWGLTPGYGVTYDPEGMLSTLPAIAAVLIGVLAGEWLRKEQTVQRRVLGMALAGALLTIGGLLLARYLPLNKRIYTTTFALFSGGISLLTFAACYLVVDVWRLRRWASPLLVFGTNAILAFALSSVITTFMDRIHVNAGSGVLTLHEWGNQIFAGFLQPVPASLAYAVTIVLLNLALLYPLYRKRIFLRV